MKQIIKGAIYKDGDVLLRAHFTGYFSAVDCTEYKTKEEIKTNYSKENAKEFLNGFYLTCDGVKYYECEYSPYDTDSMDLLSDLDSIEFYDDKTEFHS